MPGGLLSVNALLVLLAFLALLAFALVVSALRRGGRREDPLEDDADAASRFTLPVSIIVPVDRATHSLSSTITALLALHYPELEVIVVADQADSESYWPLHADWQLAPKEYFFRRTLPTSSVRRILESARDERLIVVDAERRSAAEALNCGLSLARYRYVAYAAPGTVLDANALLRVMAPALRDPERVVAATSHVEPRVATDAAVRRIWKTAAEDWQRIRFVRSWLGSRIAISRMQCGLSPQDAVVVWRRDALIESGGFLPKACDPVLDAVVRLQAVDQANASEVIRTGEIVGRMDPVGVRAAGALARQRQWGVIQAVGALRHISGNGRIPALCFVLAELLTPVAQCCLILAVVTGAALGSLSWITLPLLLAMLAFGQGAITAAALLVRGAVPEGPRSTELVRLLLLAPLEYILYRPMIAVTRIADAVSATALRVQRTRVG
jgi:hypothetical protein